MRAALFVLSAFIKLVSPRRADVPKRIDLISLARSCKFIFAKDIASVFLHWKRCKGDGESIFKCRSAFLNRSAFERQC